ncbi:hypothetical protein H5410_042929 [Solanum commersonii]|uniref:RNA-dependent RNA polymerase n=1 Tax=Solanum commersonii TaxID=4109 RepID=A0A9J5XXS0_SOLCO|nr:hypothetical protein H5410_042929 [Solanum commersonii]
MGSEDSDMNIVVTQISVGGFDNDVNAKMLSEYLEEQVGQVLRCRLKTSSTPPKSYPTYHIDEESVQRMNDYIRVEPHAFVHFASSRSANYALAATGRNELILGGKPLKVILGPGNPHCLDKRRIDEMPLKFSDVNVEIGGLVSNDDFVVGWRGPLAGVNFLVDRFNGTCKILFTKNTVFSFQSEARQAAIKCNFKIQFLTREINEIKECKDFASLVILLQLASSPLVFYRTADDDVEESVAFDLLDDDDQWIRTTDINLHVAEPLVGLIPTAKKFFRESRVPVVEPCNQRLRVRNEPDFGVPIPEPFFCIQNHGGISFKILFLVNVVLHKGIINQHQMTNDFFTLLNKHPEGINVAALKHIFSVKRPVNDSVKKLEHIQTWLWNNLNLLKGTEESADVVEVRRLAITPTKAYCLPPTVELLNRVLRNYKHVADRFLRVTFMDEGMRNLNRNVLTYYASTIVREITSKSNPQKTAIFQRVKTMLSQGFYLCGRRYSFLAFSANQLRDRSAWFFAEHPKISVPSIISWMGRFSNKNVAKYAARMGQCFSSTFATVEILPSEVYSKLPDIERNGYIFSDGIGMISTDLAIEVAIKCQSSLCLSDKYAGCKVVVACWPAKNDGIRLSVKEEIFWEMQKEMLSRLDKILVDSDVAFDIITGSCAEAGNTAAIMLNAGNKARIFVPSGRWLMGCLDELGELEQGQCFIQVSSPSLENCFVKDEKSSSNKGPCYNCKEPVSSSGDVRILEAVDVPGLHHLYDCLVFPQKGDRSHPDEASGSDLDGDLYFVAWDKNLIPPSKKSWMPMDYAPAEVKQLDRHVEHVDIIDFFSKNMVQESLGEICNAHVVHADLSELGALDEKCLKLAELAAIAVDFPKTGKLVTMPYNLRPKLYPDFMGKEEYQSYNSEKILGKLYRQVKAFVPEDIPYDTNLEIPGYEDFIAEAWNRKCSYDSQLNGLLGQYQVNGEEEHNSKKQGELKERLKHAYNALRKEFRNVFEHMEPDFDKLSIDEKNDMYETKASAWYRVTYHPHWVTRTVLELQKTDVVSNTVMLSFAWIAARGGSMADYLARIKIRQRGMQHSDSTKRIDSLGRYLVDKI